MPESAITLKIMGAVDELFDELVDFTGELVKFPSLYGAEATAQDFMAGELRGRGFEVIGHHEIMLPLLRQAVIERLARRDK